MQFFASTFAIFIHLHAHYPSLEPSPQLQLLRDCSAQYRTVSRLLLYVDSLQALTSFAVKAVESGESPALWRQQALLWHLTELEFLHPPDSVAGPILSLWRQQHFAVHRRGEGLDVLVAETHPEDREAYWTSLYRYAMQGNLSRLRDVLLLHSRFRGVSMTVT